jgi:flagellar hook-length control protein FliK
MTGGSDGTASKGSAQNIGEQIRDSVQASLARGERQLTLRLHPPELGSVLVRFREENGQIHGVLEVTRTDTRQEVEQALPHVLRSLQDSGIQIRRFEVTLAGQPEKDPGGQQPSEDARPEQEWRDQHTHRPEGSPGAGWSLEGAEPQDRIDGPGNAAGAGALARRIDVLA